LAGVGPSAWPAQHDSPVACTSLLRIGETLVPSESFDLLVGTFSVVTPLTC
jgi:hypothetical protein